ncbi:hypothetical protein [Viridibacterium curvum]|uniref:Uncharacterized protein n=1 Tax=Viridibacterium curvum TaxID=1101404 RepID=A0ABP9QRS6_9RHOO
MADFENFSQTASNIALEIERKLVILGLDWHNPVTMQQLAQSVLAEDKKSALDLLGIPASANQSFFDLQGLISLMLRTMEEGADSGQWIHGSDAWKALAKALWDQHEGIKPVPRET